MSGMPEQRDAEEASELAQGALQHIEAALAWEVR